MQWYALLLNQQWGFSDRRTEFNKMRGVVIGQRHMLRWDSKATWEEEKVLEPWKCASQSQRNSQNGENISACLFSNFFSGNGFKNTSRLIEEGQMENLYSKCMPRAQILLRLLKLARQEHVELARWTTVQQCFEHLRSFEVSLESFWPSRREPFVAITHLQCLEI